MSNVPSADTWDVEIAGGVIHTMTLDELDAAYQSGTVHESTRVRQRGAPKWLTLAAVAGAEDQRHASEPSSNGSVRLLTVPPPSRVPREFAYLADESDGARRPMKRGTKMLVAALSILAAAAVAGLIAFGVTRAG